MGRLLTRRVQSQASPALGLAPRVLSFIAYSASFILWIAVLLAVGQPLFTNDTWVHLALGRAYAQHGPWLSTDPFLFNAPGPPAPSAWLFDTALYSLHQFVGTNGLRIVHVAAVATILAFVWTILRRAARSTLFASIGTSVFMAISAYRLVQLRPHLFTIAATLVLYRLLLENRKPPSAARIACAIALCALWANFHAGFMLAPILLAAAIGAILVDMLARRGRCKAGEWRRPALLGIALFGVLASSLLNPQGFEAHLAFVTSGGDTPDLVSVIDEWAPVTLFEAPPANLPPSPLSWALVWLMVVGTTFAAIAWLREHRAQVARTSLDPALLGLSAASLCAMLIAVRFLWLGTFPLLLMAGMIASATPQVVTRRILVAFAGVAAAAILLPGFLLFGDWLMITRMLPRSAAEYALPYPAAKYFSHAVWLLDDAALEGNVHADYSLGGFMGYWLAPELMMSWSGTLNVSSDRMDDLASIRERRGGAGGETFAELLDRQEIDVLVGTGLPVVRRSGRPTFTTTAHLEDAPGWIPIFRNLRSAIHLRANERNAENLDRIADYYARAGVPFDRVRGFEAERVVVQAPDWAVAHGVVVKGFDRLVAMARTGQAVGGGLSELDVLASIYASLGLYEKATIVDQILRRRALDDTLSYRRQIWCLLRLGAVQAAAELVAKLPNAAAHDPLLRAIAEVAQHASPDPDTRAAQLAGLAVYTRSEASQFMQWFVPPRPRSEAGPLR